MPKEIFLVMNFILLSLIFLLELIPTDKRKYKFSSIPCFTMHFFL